VGGGERVRKNLPVYVVCVRERKRKRKIKKGGGRERQIHFKKVRGNARNRGESARERERGPIIVSHGMREDEMPYDCRTGCSHLTSCPPVSPTIPSRWYQNNLPTHATNVVCVCACVCLIQLSLEPEREGNHQLSIANTIVLQIRVVVLMHLAVVKNNLA